MDSKYRWVIFFVCFLIFFAMVGLANAPFSLFIVPVTEYFGFTRGDFSLIFSIMTVVGVIIQLSLGVIIKRLGLRLVMVIGSILIPMGFVLYAQATSLGLFYLGGLLVGIGFALASITSVTLLIDQWFEKGEGLILGLISAGSGFGGALFSRIIGMQIVENGFKSAYMLSAIILAVTAVPVILFIRTKPVAMQEQKETGLNKEKLYAEIQLDIPLDYGDTFKQGYFRMALAAVFLIGLIIHPVIVSTPAYLLEKGFDAVFAASVTGSIFFVLAFAKIFLGFMNDKLGIRTSLLIGLGAFILSTIALILASSKWVVWVFVVCSGTGAATLAVLIPLYARDLLGLQNYRHLLGVFVAVVSAGIGVGTPLINYVFDLTGSYTVMIALSGVIGLIALLLAVTALANKRVSQVGLSET